MDYIEAFNSPVEGITDEQAEQVFQGLFYGAEEQGIFEDEIPSLNSNLTGIEFASSLRADAKNLEIASLSGLGNSASDVLHKMADLAFAHPSADFGA